MGRRGTVYAGQLFLRERLLEHDEAGAGSRSNDSVVVGVAELLPRRQRLVSMPSVRFRHGISHSAVDGAPHANKGRQDDGGFAPSRRGGFPPDPAAVGDETARRQYDFLCKFRFKMLKKVYGTTAAYVAMAWALKSMAQRSQGTGVAPRMTAEEQGLRLRISAEQAVIAEGYDVGDARGRPVQICKPAWVGRWERLVSDDLATEDSQDSDWSATAAPAAAIASERDNAWADELAKQMNNVSGQVVFESLPPELQASVWGAKLRAQCKSEQYEAEASARLRLAVPLGAIVL